MPDPEALAREEIDRQLALAGWIVQDRNEMNLYAGPGIAIREVSIPGAGEADYLLIAKKRAIGIIEAKAKGTPLTGVEPQTGGYAAGLTGFGNPWRTPLPMLYESTGVETRFTNLLDPEPRSRQVFTFHRPETLVEWVKWANATVGADDPSPAQVTTIHAPRSARTGEPQKVAEGKASYDAGGATLAGRMQRLPVTVDDPNLWHTQRTAIEWQSAVHEEYRSAAHQGNTSTVPPLAEQ